MAWDIRCGETLEEYAKRAAFERDGYKRGFEAVKGSLENREHEIEMVRKQRDHALEGWKEAALWLKRVVGIEAMPHWAKTEPWLFEEENDATTG